MAAKRAFLKKPRAKLLAFYWQFELGTKTMYATEKKLNSMAENIGLNSGFGHHKEWIKYAKGFQLPSMKLVNQIDRLVPGSASLRSHPFWEICKLDPKVAADRAIEFYSRLDPQVSKLIFKIKKDNGLIRHRFSKEIFEQIEKRCDLDALSVLALAALEQKGKGKDDLAFAAAEALFKSLLRLPFTAPEYLGKISADLFELLNKQIFSYVTTEKKWILTDQVDFQKLIGLIELLVSHYKKDDDKETIITKLLSGPRFIKPVGSITFELPSYDLNAPLGEQIDWPKFWKEKYIEWMSLNNEHG